VEENQKLDRIWKFSNYICMLVDSNVHDHRNRQHFEMDSTNRHHQLICNKYLCQNKLKQRQDKLYLHFSTVDLLIVVLKSMKIMNKVKWWQILSLYGV